MRPLGLFLQVALVAACLLQTCGPVSSDCDDACRMRKYFYDDNGGWQYDNADCLECTLFRCVATGTVPSLSCVDSQKTLSARQIMTDPACSRIQGESVEAIPATGTDKFEPIGTFHFCAL